MPNLKLIKAADLKNLPVAQMLGSTHLVAGGLNVIFGPSGAYKSFYALGLALSIAQSDGVIYIAAEGSGGLNARVEAWCEHNKLDAGLLSFLCEEVNLLDLKSVASLITEIKKEAIPTKLVVFDTYARCIPGGDENSAKDSGIAIKHCGYIQRNLSTAVLLIHHTNRAETGERGSGAMRGGADAMVEVGLRDDVIRVECSKMKDWEAWPIENFRFKRVGPSGLLLPADDVRPSTELHAKEIKILEVLDYDVFEQCGAPAAKIGEATSIPKSMLYFYLSKLKSNGFIHQDKRGDPFSLTDLGKLMAENARRAVSVNKPNNTVNNPTASKKQVVM